MNKELQDTYEEYIELLETAVKDSTVFMHIHGIKASPEGVAKGEELRARIKELKEKTNQDSGN